MTITRLDLSKRLAGAVRHNDTLYISGQTADNVTGSVGEQTREVLAKIDALLAQGGSSKDKLLMVNIWLPNIADFDEMNAAYDAWLDKDNMPARATVEARLAISDLRVEIAAIAAAD